jgi:CheY-like chemotaxis protein
MEPEGVLTRTAFAPRLQSETARVRRSGGFLSLALLGSSRDVSPSADEAAFEEIARVTRATVRMHDHVGFLDPRTAILMPDTNMGQAVQAARRALTAARQKVPGPAAAELSAGIATIYGEVEGGGDALMASAEEALHEAPPGMPSGSLTLDGRPRILVVDDDPTFAETLAESISERGWEGHPCTHAEDAMERVGADGYSGLFVDLVLRGSSGVEVLRHAFGVKPGRPAVLMSGLDSPSSAIFDALALGPVTFVRKPLSGADLDAALEMFRHLLPGTGRRR